MRSRLAVRKGKHLPFARLAGAAQASWRWRGGFRGFWPVPSGDCSPARTIEAEEPVAVPDVEAEREERGIGRPSKDRSWLEILRRARLDGYRGGRASDGAV